MCFSCIHPEGCGLRWVELDFLGLGFLNSRIAALGLC